MRAARGVRRPLTRRALVAGAAAMPAVALAACSGEPAPAPVDPERVQLEVARGIEEQLLQALGADESAPPDAVAAVERHLDALAGALGEATPTPSGSVDPSPAPSGSASGGSIAALAPSRAADRAAAEHTRALKLASARITPLLASIAASDAAIAAVLRAGER